MIIESHNFDLNVNLVDEDPLMPVIDFPQQLAKKIQRIWRGSIIVKLLGKR